MYLNVFAFSFINVFADIFINSFFFVFGNFFISSLFDGPPFHPATWVRSCQRFLASGKVVVVTVLRSSIGQSQKAKHCKDESVHFSRACVCEMMPNILGKSFIYSKVQCRKSGSTPCTEFHCTWLLEPSCCKKRQKKSQPRNWFWGIGDVWRFWMIPNWS